MWNTYPPYMPYPVGPNQQQQEQDPLKMLKKFQKFLQKEDAKKKDKGKPKSLCEKLSSPGDTGKMITLLLLTMPISGPLYLLSMAFMWHFVKVSFATP